MGCLTGITLVRNGILLGYPFEITIISMAQMCSEVLVNIDPGQDKTLEVVRGLRKTYPHIKIIDTKWDMSNTGDGRELAVQANLLLPEVKNEWVLYLQADESIHQKDMFELKEFIRELPDRYSQLELYRTYFWENLHTRLLSDEIWLGRIFRKGTNRIGGDGMHLIRDSGDAIRSAFWIYHYSRMGLEDKVNKRLRNLDSLFHSTEVVNSFKPFSYKDDSRGKELVNYHGTHPDGVLNFFQ